ncbi:MAG: DUF58 domain-containing protein [Planctomycetota bacterium]|nr:MAG: DUF58 domain-containing protein [Planctomycetota bacterium]
MPQASDPRLLARIARLELRARTAVEGLLGGRHASPRRGSGSTFAEHREYVPGDELRHIDWRLMARSDRPFVRRYEEETRLTCWLLVDASASMAFASGETSKLDQAVGAAAALARLLELQRDRIGLAVARGEEIGEWIPDRGGPGHHRAVLAALAAAEAAGAGEPAAALAALAGRLHRRGLVVWLSDCLGDPEAAARAAARLRHAGHDLIVLRILDPAEIDFPYGRNTRFEPLEAGEALRLDPRAVRRAYLEEFEAHSRRLRQGLRALGADFRRLRCDESLEAALAEFLARRSARLRRAGR